VAKESTRQCTGMGEGTDHLYEQIRTEKEKKHNLWKITNMFCGENIEHGMYSSV
jgi:hypothetical protein